MRGYRIFLVDNDPVFGSILTGFLKRQKFEVTHLKDGRQAIGALHYNLPDILVSNVLLPFYSGLEITQFIREQLKSPIPIFLISAPGGVVKEERVLRAGATALLTKPFDPQDLLQTIDLRICDSTFHKQQPLTPTYES